MQEICFLQIQKVVTLNKGHICQEILATLIKCKNWQLQKHYQVSHDLQNNLKRFYIDNFLQMFITYAEDKFIFIGLN